MRWNMNYLSRICPEFFKSPLAFVFLIANLFICFLVSDWDKVLPYLENMNAISCKPVSEKISFGFYSCYSSYLDISETLKGFFYLVSAPSAIATAIFMSDLKAKYSYWCPETFEFLEVVSFIFFNSLYWMILGYLIETAHDSYTENNSPRKNPLSIYSNTK